MLLMQMVKTMLIALRIFCYTSVQSHLMNNNHRYYYAAVLLDRITDFACLSVSIPYANRLLTQKYNRVENPKLL